MSEKEIIWKGLYNKSHEKCIIKFEADGNQVTGNINCKVDQTLYNVEYIIVTDKNWKTLRFKVVAEAEDVTYSIEGKRNEANEWTINDALRDDLKDCLDIDISLTPATNSLPINRLKLEVNDEKIIKVVYINILEFTITLAKQKYIRVLKSTYKYENIPNDFEAYLTVDESGFVVIYPELFRRITGTQDCNS